MNVCCPLCGSFLLVEVYNLSGMPVFQNKVYGNPDDARSSVSGDVLLCNCRNCGFIWNASFDDTKMEYDENYQNEQANSSSFRLHLDEVFLVLKKNGVSSSRVVEVGCGKGFFLDRLRRENINATGFDPAYEGNHPWVIKDYFSAKYQSINAGFIVLRHTLEHISHPLAFLRDIAFSNNHQGLIYIEVPDIDWIINKNAFWDIFYEHCNYFSMKSLCSMFANVIDSGRLFGGQYLYIVADLSSFKSDGICSDSNELFLTEHGFLEGINRYKKFVKQHAPVLVWGAGAKGSTFCNIVDPECELIAGVIDVNKKKQNRFISGTGHKIFSPDEIIRMRVENILIMNENYLDEIKKMTRKNDVKLYTLGVL
ncbi:class I SAM-dependent methyltransferase [Desulfoluna spongiiphila]|uniref:C-methyltransferase C-terminal domain-containing protein n=1 Tax=Desulfoluna spongiiphila TaxID=419481 RepID=A0A1G5JG15_9BACT|nr:class I SAM-dependent methyltransferase [Desulfoluna spongiiphila]SCY87094.1 C-methyltransferase C-terminal domain-containing protein [Desulfoluna spongiiphila]